MRQAEGSHCMTQGAENLTLRETGSDGSTADGSLMDCPAGPLLPVTGLSAGELVELGEISTKWAAPTFCSMDPDFFLEPPSFDTHLCYVKFGFEPCFFLLDALKSAWPLNRVFCFSIPRKASNYYIFSMCARLWMCPRFALSATDRRSARP